MKALSSYPLIFDINRSALDDGPGIRTTVFFKGCPLRCIWCQNPESMDTGAETAFYPDLCINCGDCRKVCPENAIILDSPLRIKRKLCNRCAKCTEECPSLALKKIGQYYPVKELLEILKRDRVFYETSGGGVTFSGGEPMLYMDYVCEIMKGLKDENIHITVETCGYFELSTFREKILPYVDLIFYDIKFFDSKLHREYTGKDNQKILNNFIELYNSPHVPVIPRIPLVPTITAVTENLIQITDFLKKSGCSTYRLLTYNPAAISKRFSIGKDIPTGIPDYLPDIKQEKEWEELFR